VKDEYTEKKKEVRAQRDDESTNEDDDESTNEDDDEYTLVFNNTGIPTEDKHLQ
jgi:hypothetical protein